MGFREKFILKCIFFFIVVTQISIGQGTGKIKGTVVDAANNEPLIGANVIIEGTTIGAATDINGEFVLSSLTPDDYTLKISYVGYKEKVEKVTVIANRTTKLKVKLEWIAVKGDVVLVTAQAKGQLAAINEQLSASEIKNVVSQDRIRELPDANAAESVGRLPGVSLLRSGGEGNKVVIRGLQPKYTKVMVDGVSLPATGSSDRSVSMGMISSYSLEGIELIKAPTANMDGDQVAGSVNFVMRTAPKGLNYDFVVQGGYNGLKKTYNDYMIVGVLSNRFFEDKFGVFGQFSIDQKDQSSNSMGAGYYLNETDINDINTVYTENFSLTDKLRTRNRFGATLTLDYKFADSKIYFKNFLSSGETTSQTFNEKFSLRNRTHSYIATDLNSDQLIYNNVLNYEHDFKTFRMDAKVSHSYSETKTPKYYNLEFTLPNDITGAPLTVDPIDILQYVGYDIDRTYLQWARDKNIETKGRQIMASLDFEKDFSISKQINGVIKFGGKYRHKDRSYDIDAYGGHMSTGDGIDMKNNLIQKMGWSDILPMGTTQIPYDLFINKNYDYGDFLNGDYSLGPVTDIDILNRVIDILKNHNSNDTDTKYSNLKRTSSLNDYSGIENLAAGYLMVDVDITNQIKFIPGVRYESNRTEYTGVFGMSTSVKPEENYPHKDTTTTRENDFWLPMIQLQYKPFDWLQIRAAYTKTLSRPNFSTIIPKRDIGVEKILLNNFNIRPEQSENYDLFIAFKDNYLGLLTIGGFIKNITDKIYALGERIILDPTYYNLPDVYKNYLIKYQENNENLSVSEGFEIDWQTNFWYLPSFLKGIVLNVNFTKIFSETYYPRTIIESEYLLEPPYGIKYTNNDTTYTDRLIGQPNHTLNLGIGYDYKDFSFRISMLYQSDIFATTNFWPELRTATDDYLRWDLRVQQNLPWYGLQVFLNFTNITSAIERNINIVTEKPTSLSHYGKGIQVGIRLRNN